MADVDLRFADVILINEFEMGASEGASEISPEEEEEWL